MELSQDVADDEFVGRKLSSGKLSGGKLSGGNHLCWWLVVCEGVRASSKDSSL